MVTRNRVRWRYGGHRDGAWQTVEVVDPAEAKRVMAWVVSQARRVTREQVLDHFTGPPEPVGGQTVAAWLGEYVGKLTALEDSTRAAYRRIVAQHVKVAPFGSIPLAAVTRDDFRQWVAWQQTIVAPKTLSNHRALISAGLAEAVHIGKLDRNPCAGVRMPRPDAGRTGAAMSILTPAEVARVVSVLTPDVLKPLPIVLARTGLRWGEVTALRAGDIVLDGDNPTLTVNRAWKRGATGGVYYLGVPKSRRSRRTIALDPETVEVLLPLTEGYPADALIFPGRGGNGRSMFMDHFGPACDIALGRRVRIHDLRHTHASWLITAGVPLPTIQARLGHESITTTINVYGHLMRESDAQVVRALVGLSSRAR